MYRQLHSYTVRGRIHLSKTAREMQRCNSWPVNTNENYVTLKQGSVYLVLRCSKLTKPVQHLHICTFYTKIVSRQRSHKFLKYLLTMDHLLYHLHLYRNNLNDNARIIIDSCQRQNNRVFLNLISEIKGGNFVCSITKVDFDGLPY